MDLDIDPAWLFVSFLVGTIGLAMLLYGRRAGRVPHLVVGLTMLVYPYFVGSWPLQLGIAALLLGGLWWVSRRGW